jgi:hypothetical protein
MSKPTLQVDTAKATGPAFGNSFEVVATVTKPDGGKINAHMEVCRGYSSHGSGPSDRTIVALARNHLNNDLKNAGATQMAQVKGLKEEALRVAQRIWDSFAPTAEQVEAIKNRTAEGLKLELVQRYGSDNVEVTLAGTPYGTWKLWGSTRFSISRAKDGTFTPNYAGQDTGFDTEAPKEPEPGKRSTYNWAAALSQHARYQVAQVLRPAVEAFIQTDAADGLRVAERERLQSAIRRAEEDVASAQRDLERARQMVKSTTAALEAFEAGKPAPEPVEA